jgi:hypothetical protein
MQMLEILALVCSLQNPDECRTERFTTTSGWCGVSAMAEMAPWAEDATQYQIKRWDCRRIFVASTEKDPAP